MAKISTCSSGKKLYLSEALAEEALLGAHVQFDFAQGTGPIAVYRCDDCGYFHLTSQGLINTKLKDFLASGDYKRLRQAAAWTSKLKHKY